MRREGLTRRRLLVAAGGAAAAGGGVGGWLAASGEGPRRRRPPVALENAHVRLELDPDDGAVVQLTNLDRGLRLVAGEPGVPWRIRLFDGTILTRPRSFRLDRTADGARLRWTTERGDVVEVTATLPRGEPTARFRVSLRPGPGPQAEVLEYPVVGGIGALSEADELLHAYATGFVFRNPIEIFRDGADDPSRGVLYGPYPECFNGPALQLMAYYAVGRGGFTFSTEDATGAQKWLGFYKQGAHLEAAIGHGSADLTKPLEPPYDVVVGALTEGTWTEPADRYKAWAVRQPWCSRGLLSARPERDRWLHEQVGLATFGIDASHDRALWLRAIHGYAGTPVLHILGPNWTKVPQDYENHLPGGLADWFPARFDPANVAAIRSQGDRLAPFEFDLLFGQWGSDRTEGVAALEAIPQPTLSFDQYSFPFLCPTTPFLQRLHRERDARLAGEYGVDAVYYDISANNVEKRCYDTAHGHPRGGGAFLVDAYRTLYGDTAAAMTAASGRTVPQGTELANEVFVDRLDLYQARAEASPASAFEADAFRDWIKQGHVEKVPLFAYVYHEYGPLRLDGWGKLSREQGDLFYWIGARVLAWGGLFELNYEYSPLETIGGHAEPLDQHYAPLPDRRYAVDPAKARYVRELASARVGPANRYLAYGTMLPPLPLESPTVDLRWFHYNCPEGWPAYADYGTQTVPAVVHCAWREGDAAGVVLVDVDARPHRVRVPLSADALRLDPGADHVVELVAGGTRRRLGPLAGAVDVELPSRQVVLLEIVPRPEGG